MSNFNTMYNNIEIKDIPFNTLEEVKDYAYMSVTDRAKQFAELIRPSIKGIDKDFVYYYDSKLNIWNKSFMNDFINYTFDFFSATSKNIKKVYTRTHDENETNRNKLINYLIGSLDKRNYIEDIAKRTYSYILDSSFVTCLDTSPNLFSISNGKKIDLRTLVVTKRTKEDYLSNESNVQYLPGLTKNADKFFCEIMPNLEEREYMRKVLGYCITGETSARSFFIWLGHGSNGKSKIFELLNLILGSLYHQCDKSIFIKSSNSSKGPSPELIGLLGKRVAVYSEGETSDKIEMNLCCIKQISGDDKINARQLYSQPIEFKTNAKLNMLTNFTPSLNAEKAIVDRTRYVYLDSVFSHNPKKGELKIDNVFTENLATIYLSEVFTWIAKGSYEFYKDMKITMPDSFIERTKQVFLNEDSISTFITRKIIKIDDDKKFIRKGDLFEEFKTFCDDNSQRCHKRSELFDRLKELKYTTSVKDGYDVYRGIKIRNTKVKNIDITMDEDTDDEGEYKEAYEKALIEIEQLKQKIEKMKIDNIVIIEPIAKQLIKPKPKLNNQNSNRLTRMKASNETDDDEEDDIKKESNDNIAITDDDDVIEPIKQLNDTENKDEEKFTPLTVTDCDQLLKCFCDSDDEDDDED